MQTILAVNQGNPNTAIRDFLAALLQKGSLDGLLLPLRSSTGAVYHSLVTKPELLEHADLLAPVLPANGATLAGKLSSRESHARIGAVLRACELRALVELAKLKQAYLDNLTLIAIDCAGTYSVPVYMRETAGSTDRGIEIWRKLFHDAAANPDTPDPDLRQACKMCEQPVFPDASISILFLGSDLSQAVHISLPDEIGADLGFEETAPNGREQVLGMLTVARKGRLEKELAEMEERLDGEGLANVFAACIRCHNCMTVCPICYCKTCVFKSAIFDHAPEQYLQWAQAKGACRMPTDTVLFHLTRMNHMVLSCVGCGMCTEACPAELPVGLAFRTSGRRLQSVFEYAPGRNQEEPLPLITFQADEWNEVGE